MKNVIVIGADGFLGSHLVNQLSIKCKRIMALFFDKSRLLNIENSQNVEYKHFSFENILDINGEGYDTIYHMAWEGVNSMHRNDVILQIKNIQYGIIVLDFAKKNNIRRVIFPGSAAEASCNDGVIRGNSVPAPSDIYSASKVANRYICQTYAHQLGLDFIYTLITSIYGPGRDDNNILSYTIKTLLKGKCPSFTKLEQTWDFLYIDDLIAALIALGEKGIGGKVYPIGSGTSRKLSDYIMFIRDTINPNLSLGIGNLPYKNAIVDNQILDITDLINDTGYTPKISFEEGIMDMIQYYKNLSNEEG